MRFVSFFIVSFFICCLLLACAWPAQSAVTGDGVYIRRVDEDDPHDEDPHHDEEDHDEEDHDEDHDDEHDEDQHDEDQHDEDHHDEPDEDHHDEDHHDDHDEEVGEYFDPDAEGQEFIANFLRYRRIKVAVMCEPTMLEEEQAEQIMHTLYTEGIDHTEVVQICKEEHNKWWTFSSMIHSIYEENKQLEKEEKMQYDWLIVVWPETNATLLGIAKALRLLDQNSSLWLGTPIQDTSHYIVHGYHGPGLNFPFPRSDMVFSRKLIMDYGAHVAKEHVDIASIQTDLAHHVAVDIKKSLDVSLETLPSLELYDESMRHVERRPPAETTEKEMKIFLSTEYVVFGIKTSEQFHNTRVGVISDTWLPDIAKGAFFSNATIEHHGDDDVIRTIWKHVPNTESGHCAKMYAILEWYGEIYFREYPDHHNYLVIADDDTLLSVPRLIDYLSWADFNDELAFGERYWFQVGIDGGYSFPTGGSGMILTTAAVKKILACEDCRCAKDNTPDDMTLGMWLNRLNIPLVHVPGLHQASPNQYTQRILDGVKHISFHSCHQGSWDECDPRAAYDTYLREETRLADDEL